MIAHDDDEQLFLELEEVLRGYSALRAVLPVGFPRANRFHISMAKMRKFNATRMETYWHHMNLPLLLHASQSLVSERVRSLATSMLTALNDYAAHFGGLRGASTLLSPLWQNMWGKTPELWSVISCAYMALCYRADGIEVIGFESLIGRKAKDDITIRLRGKITHVEVEAFHAPSFEQRSDPEVIAELAARADRKAAKFRDLAADEAGIVAVICVISEKDQGRRFSIPVQHVAGRAPNVGWMAHRLVGVDHPDGLRFALTPF